MAMPINPPRIAPKKAHPPPPREPIAKPIPPQIIAQIMLLMNPIEIYLPNGKGKRLAESQSA